MIVDLFVKDERRGVTFVLAQVVLLACALRRRCSCSGAARAASATYTFNGLFVADVMAHLLKLAAYLAVSAALVYSRQYLLDRGLLRGEFLTLLLFCAARHDGDDQRRRASSRCTSAWS